MTCICDTLPKDYKAYVTKEFRHPDPPEKSNRHMHIGRRGRRLYRVEWGTDKKTGRRFVNVEGEDERFVRKIERWVLIKFDELGETHDNVIAGRKFDLVEWAD